MLKCQQLHDKYNMWASGSKKNIRFYFLAFLILEHLKFHAQLSWALKKFYNQLSLPR